MTRPGPKQHPREQRLSLTLLCTREQLETIHAAAIIEGCDSTNDWAVDMLTSQASHECTSYAMRHGAKSLDRIRMRGK